MYNANRKSTYNKLKNEKYHHNKSAVNPLKTVDIFFLPAIICRAFKWNINIIYFPKFCFVSTYNYEKELFSKTFVFFPKKQARLTLNGSYPLLFRLPPEPIIHKSTLYYIVTIPLWIDRKDRSDHPLSANCRFVFISVPIYRVTTYDWVSVPMSWYVIRDM